MTCKTILTLLLVILLTATFGCDQGVPTTLPPATEGGGFLLATLLDNNTGVNVPVGGVEVQGDWLKDYPGAAGDPSQIHGAAGLSSFNPPGLISLPGKRAPARWRWHWIAGGPQPLCYSPAVTFDIDAPLNGLVGFICVARDVIVADTGGIFIFSPTPVYTYSPPSTGTITGSNLSQRYGMPLVQYYAVNGTLIAQENANYVSSDGTTITLAGGDVSNLSPGAYAGFISNANSDGSWSDIGTASVEVNGPINLGSMSVSYGEWNYAYYYAATLNHPYATVTNAYLKTGDPYQWQVFVAHYYDPYPTLVPAADILFQPTQTGTFQAIMHIDLSDGASFDLEFIGTGTP